jgi:hypothetical protein
MHPMAWCTAGFSGRTLALITMSVAIACGGSPGGASAASSAPPCAAGTTVPPTVEITDTSTAAREFVATHPLQAVWSASNSDGTLFLDNYTVSPPFTIGADESSASFVPARAGNYTFGLGWDQHQIFGPDNNACSSSLQKVINVLPAKRPRFGPIHYSFGGSLAERITELSWTLNTGVKRLNLGLITAELQAVGRDRLPTSHTPKHRLRFPLCDCDPLFGKVHNPSTVRVGPIQLVPNTEFGIRFLIDIKVSTTRTTRFGYQLLVRQGTHRLGRLRVAGTCHFRGGFSNCAVDHYSVQR